MTDRHEPDPDPEIGLTSASPLEALSVEQAGSPVAGARTEAVRGCREKLN